MDLRRSKFYGIVQTCNCATPWDYDADLGVFKVWCWKRRITGIGGPIETERKGCESIVSETRFVTLNFNLSCDIDFDVLRSKFEKALFQE